MVKVLLLEDEDAIRGFVKINLKRDGMEVIEATTGEEALQAAEDHAGIDIALIDVMLPSIDGFEVCARLRERHPHLGIIMLTARAQDADKVKGLELGADDYVAKPFSPTELIARIKALHRRMKPILKSAEDELQQIDATLYRSGIFELSLDERQLKKSGTEIVITPTEMALMALFMEHPNKSLSRDNILDAVWGKYYVGDIKNCRCKHSSIASKN